jgi:hypothetical protein
MSDRRSREHGLAGARRSLWVIALTAGVILTGVVIGLATGSSSTYAADPPVALGTAGTYSVLGGQTVTSTGATTLSGDLGVSPGTAITGFPPGTRAGTTHAGDPEAAQAQADLVIAYNDAAARAPTAGVSGNLGGQTFFPGVYNSASTLGITGTVTFDGQGDLDAIFVIQMGTTLTTAAASNVNLINGAQACHVFWQVGSSATLGASSSFRGTIMALASITVGATVNFEGGALARDGSVTLDSDTFTMPACVAVPVTTTTEPPTTTTTEQPTTTTTTTTESPTTTTTDPTVATASTENGGGGPQAPSRPALEHSPSGLVGHPTTGAGTVLSVLFMLGVALLVLGAALVVAARHLHLASPR